METGGRREVGAECRVERRVGPSRWQINKSSDIADLKSYRALEWNGLFTYKILRFIFRGKIWWRRLPFRDRNTTISYSVVYGNICGVHWVSRGL